MSADLIEEPGGPREWLIKKDGYFYRPNKSGYTAVKSEAGRYSEWDARREAEIEPWHMSAVHQDNAPEPLGDFNVARIAALTDALAAKDTAISEITKERDAEAKETERLRAIVEERFKDTRLVNAGGRVEGFGFDLMGGPIPYIAEYLVQFMGHRDEGGAANYSEMEVYHNELGALTLTMQRRTGKTPHQLRAEADARATAAEAALSEMRAELELARKALIRIEAVAKDRSEKAWFRLESIADEAHYAARAASQDEGEER